MADMMMNRGKFTYSLADKIKQIILPDEVMLYLKSLRYCQYYADCERNPLHLYPLILFHKLRLRKLGVKLGFSIGCQTLGYGVTIPHYGTIVIGESNRIGNYAVLHTSTCITGNSKQIGDALYLSTGVKITSRITIGDNVSIGANSVVNKSFDSNMMIAGAPAKQIKYAEAWYVRDGEEFSTRVRKVEKLKEKIINEN